MKPGIYTTEFWLVVVTNVLTQAGALDVPSSDRWLITLATIVGYALSRGLAKSAPSSATPAVHQAADALAKVAARLGRIDQGAGITPPPAGPGPRQATP